MKKVFKMMIVVTVVLFAGCQSSDLIGIDNEDSTKISDSFIRNVDGSIISEIPVEIYDLLLLDLEKADKQENRNSIIEKYMLDADKQNYILKKEYALNSQEHTRVANNTFFYQAHLAWDGWQNFVSLGEIAGTTGQEHAIEAIMFSSNVYIPGFTAQAHVRGKGWLPVVSFGEIVGTVGEKRNLEAIKVNVPSSFGTNVYYRVHASFIGWMPYVSNNTMAGTVGEGRGIEAFQMHMLIVN